ncbi:peptidase M56 BlaR1 [Catenovulum agarivorans DS-2]|uniref:Peptidase M56 BlaR1 n=1 Tax=Catenovulum agarivorans DS-2 TaxID=1328313 RepID=W7QQT3_9ALTE|nr:M56 family metallopeptidase [Catenovulum agarivorans]EWH11357.1 peptidase M56 BlaR1 [Catenovulum agarivorans DS-2]
MLDIAQAIGQIILLFALSFTISALVQAGFYQFLLRKITNLTSTWRNLPSNIYLLLSALPLCIALLTVLVLFNPNLFPNIVLPHCHGNNCQPHAMTLPENHAPLHYLTALLLMILFVIFTLVIRQVRLAKSYLLALRNFSKETQQGFKVIDSNKPLAWCAGVLKPEIFVSSQLIKTLSQQQLSLVLAHELAHKLHKDNLRKLLVSWLTKVWPKQIAANFYRRFSNTLEIEADVRALQQIEATDLNTYCQTIEACCQCSSQSQRSTLAQLQLTQQFNTRRLVFRLTISIVALAGALLLLIYLARFLHPIIEWLG